MRRKLQAARTAPAANRWSKWARRLATVVVAGALAVGLAVPALSAGSSAKSAAHRGGSVTLTIESWRTDDLSLWQKKIIPVFEKSHPGIKLKFSPTNPPDYNAALDSRLKGGSAGDIITCRPFDASLNLFKQGHLASLNGLPGLSNFSSVAKSAWITDDGKTVFCVPMASVIHGFIYNKDIFSKLGLREPRTEAQFFALLDKIKQDGKYAPLAMGTHDLWEAATMGFQNIGPDYWRGEAGRKALIAGVAKFTDKPYVDTFRTLAKWGPYLENGAPSVTYSDAQNLFTQGRAAIYPSGSWEIPLFESKAKFKMGVFKPPLPAGRTQCYISDHTDIAMGVNTASKNQAEAKVFLRWVASPAFGKLYSNSLPGFFSLQTKPVPTVDPLAKTFVSWRKTCKTTIRNSYQILSRGTPNLENELWLVSAAVMNGKMTPEQATQRLQKGLDRWYHPKKK
jgi:raffinose/stachyose/melibiose transport system substrate-binding protein